MLQRFTKTLIPLPLHPLYLFTLSLALGIAWQAKQIPLYIPLSIVGLVGYLLLVQQLKNPKKNSNSLPLFIVATVIFCVGALRYQQGIDDFNSFYQALDRRPVNLVARVIDCEPSYKQGGTFIATLTIEQAEFITYTKRDGHSCPSIHFSYGNESLRKNTQDARQGENSQISQELEPTQSPAHPECFRSMVHAEKMYQRACAGTDPDITGHYFIAILPDKPPFRAGDTVLLKRIFFFPPADKSDYAKYLVKSGLVAHIQIKPESVSVLKHPIRSFYRTLSELRNNILESAKKQLSPPTFALFTSIFWGKHAVDQQQLNSIREQFRPWGILHYLARAGLHVTMLILLLEKTISFLPLPFMVRTVLGAGLIGGYALISWSSISFIRALLVFFIFILCTLLWAPSQGLYRLSLACFLILLWNPFQLFFLDFQLSFLVTAVFMWMATITKAENS